jgi:transcription initiation protein SPT3
MDLAKNCPLSYDAEQKRQRIIFRHMLISTMRQMMYVSGETAEPPVETTSIIEDIVRQQVIELVSLPTRLI